MKEMKLQRLLYQMLQKHQLVMQHGTLTITDDDSSCTNCYLNFICIKCCEDASALTLTATLSGTTTEQLQLTISTAGTGH